MGGETSLINCDVTRCEPNKAHGILMTAVLWQMYANTPDSAHALPLLLVFVFFFLISKFRVCSVRVPARMKTS